MRAFILSISAMLLMIIIVMIAMSFMHSNINDFLNMLDNSKQEYLNNNQKAAIETLNKLSDKFDKLRPIFCIMINHNEISKAEISLLKLKVYLEKGENALFEAEYDSLVFILDNIYSSEILNFANLF